MQQKKLLHRRRNKTLAGIYCSICGSLQYRIPKEEKQSLKEEDRYEKMI